MAESTTTMTEALSSTRRNAKLAWVLVDGQLHHVAEYSDLPPYDRPQCICPICHLPVVLKLGSIRIHHAAHAVDSQCPATNPETALHFNAKFHILKQLSLSNVLLVDQFCEHVMSKDCEIARAIPYIENWDEAKLEYPYGQYRPDIVMMSNGKVIGIIEVVVSHAMQEEKVNYLTEEKIAWLEVNADEILDEENGYWNIQQPIPKISYNKNVSSHEEWVCPPCNLVLEAERIKRERKEYVKKLSEQTTITAFLVVDFYYPSGKQYRDIFYAKKNEINGTIKNMWIESDSSDVIGLTVVKKVNEARSQLQAKFNKYIGSLGGIADHPMKWQVYRGGLDRDDIFSFKALPKRYFFNEKTNRWQLKSFLKVFFNFENEPTWGKN